MLTGNGLVEYARGKIGTPYFFGAKMQILTRDYMLTMHRLYPGTVSESYMEKAIKRGQVGKINTDCSGLIGAYTGRQIGSYQLYQQAYTRLPVSTYNQWADGVVCWRPGHVGVFFRDGNSYKVIEAKGINYGTVISDFDKSKWKYGLTFSWINYKYEETVSDKTWRETNPYAVPTSNLRRGSNGEPVKWLQWELVQSGFTLDIDGAFGPLTDQALREFQRSAKIEVDGICGKITRKYLLADDKKEEFNDTGNGMQIGIDVAKWQGVIDWNKVKADGIAFAILKVTTKNNSVEDSFERNYSGCKSVGMPIGVYRYVYARSVDMARAEAQGILAALKEKSIEGKIWLDMEDKSIAGIGKAALTIIIDTEAEILKDAGYKVGIYANRDWYEHTLDGVGLSDRYKFWIAKYGKNTGVWEGRSDNPRDIAYAWQYTSKGRVDGIKGDVDMDLLY